MATTSELSGYLGYSMDGDFTISGYSKAATDHPSTDKYQKSRGISGIRTPEQISYNEN